MCRLMVKVKRDFYLPADVSRRLDHMCELTSTSKSVMAERLIKAGMDQMEEAMRRLNDVEDGIHAGLIGATALALLCALPWF